MSRRMVRGWTSSSRAKVVALGQRPARMAWSIAMMRTSGGRDARCMELCSLVMEPFGPDDAPRLHATGILSQGVGQPWSLPPDFFPEVISRVGSDAMLLPNRSYAGWDRSWLVGAERRLGKRIDWNL